MLYDVVLEVDGSCNNTTCTGELTAEKLLIYLFERGHVTTADLMNGSFKICDLSARNRNFSVIGGNRRLFVKQARSELNHEECISREAVMLWALAGHRDALDAVLPHLIEYDPGNQIMVFDLVAGETLRETACQDVAALAGIAARLGTALAALHDSADTAADDMALKRRLPISEGRPQLAPLCFAHPKHMIEASPAQIEIAQVLHSSQALRTCLTSPATPEIKTTLIHGDLRGENIIVRTSPQDVCPVLVDFELSGIGDAAWDVSCFLCEAVMPWVSSTTVDSRGPGADMVTTGHSLSDVRKIASAHWTAYLESRAGLTESPKQFLRRVLANMVTRLVQRVFEQAARGQRLTNYAILLLQLAENVATDPVGAGREVLGLSAT